MTKTRTGNFQKNKKNIIETFHRTRSVQFSNNYVI